MLSIVNVPRFLLISHPQDLSYAEMDRGQKLYIERRESSTVVGRCAGTEH